ncbi:MAG: 2-isopropylmalate synthase [Firmicutes bacterium]|nr:2-isopropylmalate synthase [Bacillota bacterium]
MKIEIMDTTLRDGEQTSGVAFTDTEKLTISKMLLEELKVDRIEVASAGVSQGEFEAVKKITGWAKEKGFLEKIEVLCFIGEKSLEWVYQAGARAINLLCKGSLKHVSIQLRKKPEEHLADIKNIIASAQRLGMKTNIYLEDWSNGMKDSPDYVMFLVGALKDEPVERFMLPDTLGILNPDQAFQYCKLMLEKFPGLKFDFHGHNDYDLAVANSYAAIKAGFSGVHTTVNGLGERAGNAPLASVIAVLKDQLKVNLDINESKLNKISKMVEVFTGIRIPSNKPIIGEYVFTQCCGVHADGDSKGNLYFNDLIPERFGRVRKYALGKTSGKASIQKNLEELGIELEPEAMKKVTARIVEIGDQKENITTEDLPYIIADVLGEITEERVKIKNYSICHAHGIRPMATVCVIIDGQEYQETSAGDGQYDAFMKALARIYQSIGKKLPVLTDYVVTIPPGGKTDALVETVISWQANGREYKTRGLDPDQTAAAIKATLKILNLIED